MFYNYLTGYKAYLKKHVKSVFPFSNTTGMTNEEVRAAVRRMTVESALPIPEESYNWFAQYFRYVGDKDAVLVYDNRTGVWHYERSDMSLRALITDYFTAVSEVASQHDDILLKTYASSFFASSRISQIAERIKSSVAVRIQRGVDITLMTEQYRYLPTTDGKRVVIDMNADTFNAEVKTFAETQDMMFTGVGAIPIELGDDWTPHTTGSHGLMSTRATPGSHRRNMLRARTTSRRSSRTCSRHITTTKSCSTGSGRAVRTGRAPCSRSSKTCLVPLQQG